jgi:DNA replication initiation complex subunit (GINS family)
MEEDNLLGTELNQAGWSEETIKEVEDPLYESAISLARALGLETFILMMAEESGDTEYAEKQKELIDKYQDQLRRIVKLRIRMQKED